MLCKAMVSCKKKDNFLASNEDYIPHCGIYIYLQAGTESVHLLAFIVKPCKEISIPPSETFF